MLFGHVSSMLMNIRHGKPLGGVQGVHPSGWIWAGPLVRLLQCYTRGVPQRAVTRVRSDLHHLPLVSMRAAGVRLTCSRLAGCEVEIATPKRWSVRGSVILYLHGGGYGICSPRTHRHLVTRLARAAKAQIFCLRYRLAPEHPFPCGLDDSASALDVLMREFGHERVFVAGDSAGGGLALAALMRRRSEGKAMPRGVVLFSPWVDLSPEAPLSLENRAYDYLTPASLVAFAGRYATMQERQGGLVSPLRADLAGLPPTFVLWGSGELLHRQIQAFIERARKAGVDVTCEVRTGMIHVWPMLAPVWGEARQAIHRAGRFVQQRGVCDMSEKRLRAAGPGLQAHPCSAAR